MPDDAAGNWAAVLAACDVKVFPLRESSLPGEALYRSTCSVSAIQSPCPLKFVAFAGQSIASVRRLHSDAGAAQDPNQGRLGKIPSIAMIQFMTR